MPTSTVEDSGTEDTPDVVIEMVQGDTVDDVEFSALEKLVREAGASELSVARGQSALEPHGKPWWFCVYLWCLTDTATERESAVAEAVCEWGREWRVRTATRRPVFVAVLDRSGQTSRAALVRARVSPRPVHPHRPRVPPSIVSSAR